MSLPPIMQKGLTALLKVVEFTDPNNLNQAITALEQHFTLSADEIAQAFQKSYESTLNAIIIGLDKPSWLSAKVIDEFAEIVTNTLPAFAAHANISDGELSLFCANAKAKCQTLIPYQKQLFRANKTRVKKNEWAALLTDNKPLSLTEFMLTEWQQLEGTRPHLDKHYVAFLRYNDLLGKGLLFFLEEELRRNERFRVTLQELRSQGLWQDIRKIIKLLEKIMPNRDLSTPIQPRDELTHHTSDSLRLIREAVAQLKKLPPNHPQYSQLMIKGATVLSSSGNLNESERLLLQAQQMAQNDVDKALVAFNLFQIRLRRGEFESALANLQAAIQLDAHRYALHEIDKYPIKRILGAGGMGVVFLCHHKLRKQRRVVKCFWEARQGPAETVFREAFAMHKIAGDFVPQPLDYGYVDTLKQERAFFVTEYIEGAIDGETWLKQQGPLNLTNGLAVALQLAQGLHKAHTAGVLHLDLKPANILLKSEKNSVISVKIIDFGLAQVATSLQQEIQQTQLKTNYSMLVGQVIFGTLNYACPEQQGEGHYGKPSVLCDIFAFGQTMKRLLTGKKPQYFLERDLPNVPKLLKLLLDCTEESPNKRRPKSAQQLVKRLEKIVIVSTKPKPLLPSLYRLLTWFHIKGNHLLKLPKLLLPSLYWLLTWFHIKGNHLLKLPKLLLPSLYRLLTWFHIKGNYLLKLPKLLLPSLYRLLKLSKPQMPTDNDKVFPNLSNDKIFYDHLQDGSLGPEMVVIPAGRFRMGDIISKVHWVSVKIFVIGRYEVTFAEYDQFAQATGRKLPNDKGWGRNRRPVINVSWYDAVDYAEWLSQQTEKRYQLPTVVEWSAVWCGLRRRQ